MQICNWGDTGSLGAAPVSNLSPRRLGLLERRITGSSNPPPTGSGTGGTQDKKPDHAAPASPENNMVTERSVIAQTAHAVQHHGTTDEPIYIPDTQEETMLPAELAAAVQSIAATGDRKSPTPSGADILTSASKRRKTGKPQHRPMDSAAGGADSKQGALAAAASNGAIKDTMQRDKPVRARLSPRVKSEGGHAAGYSAGEGVAGNSNPPMSPPSAGVYCSGFFAPPAIDQGLLILSKPLMVACLQCCSDVCGDLGLICACSPAAFFNALMAADALLQIGRGP